MLIDVHPYLLMFNPYVHSCLFTLFKEQILLVYMMFTGEYERHLGILVLYHATLGEIYSGATHLQQNGPSVAVRHTWSGRTTHGNKDSDRWSGGHLQRRTNCGMTVHKNTTVCKLEIIIYGCLYGVIYCQLVSCSQTFYHS